MLNLITIAVSYSFLSVSSFAAETLVDQGTYFIKASNGQYVNCSESGSGLGDFVQKTSFTLIKTANDMIFIKLPNNMYAGAHQYNESVYGAWEPKDWETFSIEKRNDGKYYIKSIHNTYLRANLDKKILDQSAVKGEWEALELIHASPGKRKYLLVLVHGLFDQPSTMEAHLGQMVEIYKMKHPNANATEFFEQFEVYCPHGPNNRWFEIPEASLSGFAYLIMSGMMYSDGVTDQIKGFRDNLNWLRVAIEERLARLNLGYEDLIIGGASQGCITALTFGLESPRPVKAIIGAIGMWFPCAIKSQPRNILLTNGAKDGVISYSTMSVPTYFYLQKQLSEVKVETKLFDDDGHNVSESQLKEIVNFIEKLVLDY